MPPSTPRGSAPDVGRRFTLDEALSIVRGATLSRAAVETSTPEQIVWLTAEAIAHDFRVARLDQVAERERVDAAVRRAVDRAGLPVKVRERFLRVLEAELSGWPSRCHSPTSSPAGPPSNNWPTVPGWSRRAAKWVSRTATSEARRATMDEDGGLTRVSMETIIEYGHQVIGVFAPDDPDLPDDDFVPFAYTVGRSLKDRPELLITGPLPPDILGMILNNAAVFDDEHGLVAGTDVPPDTILAGGMPLRVANADPDAAEMNQAIHLFGPDIAALQLLWPDKHGRLPGDAGCEIPDGIQPQYPPRSGR